MPSKTSYERFLEKIQTNIKHELGELQKFVDLHPDFMSSIKVPDGEWFESGNTLNFKIQKTSSRLMEQLDVLIKHCKASPDLQVRNKSESTGGSSQLPAKVRKRGRKTKTSG